MGKGLANECAKERYTLQWRNIYHHNLKWMSRADRLLMKRFFLYTVFTPGLPFTTTDSSYHRQSSNPFAWKLLEALDTSAGSKLVTELFHKTRWRVDKGEWVERQRSGQMITDAIASQTYKWILIKQKTLIINLCHTRLRILPPMGKKSECWISDRRQKSIIAPPSVRGVWNAEEKLRDCFMSPAWVGKTSSKIKVNFQDLFCDERIKVSLKHPEGCFESGKCVNFIRKAGTFMTQFLRYQFSTSSSYFILLGTEFSIHLFEEAQGNYFQTRKSRGIDGEPGSVSASGNYKFSFEGPFMGDVRISRESWALAQYQSDVIGSNIL